MQNKYNKKEYRKRMSKYLFNSQKKTKVVINNKEKAVKNR